MTFLRLGARVIALEPNPNCTPVLNFEFGRNRDFQVISKAVGAEPGVATLNFANAISTASLRADWHGLQYRDGQLEQRNVEVTTLDALIAQYGIPAFCKIDVEGFETEVLKGLSQPLPMLSLEYHRDEAGKAIECLDILSKLAPLKVNAIVIDSALAAERVRCLSIMQAMLWASPSGPA